MRRKSERTTAKKVKASPEKKIEKLKRTRSTKRRKHSSSSENESPDAASPVHTEETKEETEQNPAQSQIDTENPEDTQDQVWRVKTAEGSGDIGEIQKLKICLTRPLTTPESVDKSPRSRRKHSRATSSSDTPSVEVVEEKKKPRHRKRTVRGKDDSEKNDSQGEDCELDKEKKSDNEEKSSNKVSQSELSQDSVKDSEIPMSTIDEHVKSIENDPGSQSNETSPDNESHDPSDADTIRAIVSTKEEESKDVSLNENVVVTDVENQNEQSDEIELVSSVKIDEKINTPERKRSISEEKSEVLELHADESKIESFDESSQPNGEDMSSQPKGPDMASQPKGEDKAIQPKGEDKPTEPKGEDKASQPKGDEKEDSKTPQEKAAKEQSSSVDSKVSKVEESVSNNSKAIDTDTSKATNEPDVVESPQTSKDTKDITTLDKGNKTPDKKGNEKEKSVPEVQKYRELQRSNSVQSNQESITNGQPTPAVGRKRKWGSRTTKPTTQKSITISTDVLKDIIPDVKPVEFDEVIEDKKHRREREVTEKVYRPILPKIIIDNTENVEQKKEQVEMEQESKPRDLASNRKISIIRDNDSIIARPPSPPRNKQSCILYITNLVRPFTLTQLKNLLQRTGRIVDNGFCIDRIKSKCFVQYENEEQAVETRHALHGVTWPVSNPKTLHVDFSTEEAFEKAKINEESDTVPLATKPGTVEDWLKEQDMKRDRGEVEKPWERKASTREWDLGKNEKDKDKEKSRMDERPTDKRRRRSPEKSPEPARKFKKKEEEAPAKLLDDLFRKTKTTPCIYWLPLSAETIAIKEQQRRQHMAEHERRLLELRRTHRRH